MLGLTRFELLFLENHRSIWVVIIGLELLSLARHLCLCHPVIIMVILMLLVQRIGFGVTRSRTCRCDASGSRLLSGVMLEAGG
jgi:uncharacterized protein YqhQ